MNNGLFNTAIISALKRFTPLKHKNKKSHVISQLFFYFPIVRVKHHACGKFVWSCLISKIFFTPNNHGKENWRVTNDHKSKNSYWKLQLRFFFFSERWKVFRWFIISRYSLFFLISFEKDTVFKKHNDRPMLQRSSFFTTNSVTNLIIPTVMLIFLAI